jgi:hypothetical protein
MPDAETPSRPGAIHSVAARDPRAVGELAMVRGERTGHSPRVRRFSACSRGTVPPARVGPTGSM